jgi:hypothetical protein
MGIEEFDAAAAAHKKWLNGEEGGERFAVANENLRGMDFAGKDLRKAILRYSFLSGADLRHADLREADLTGADFQGAEMCAVDLRGARIDDSSGIPLYEGGLSLRLDAKQMRKLAEHFVSMLCDDEEAKAAQKALTPFAHNWKLWEKGPTISLTAKIPAQAEARKPEGDAKIKKTPREQKARARVCS